MLRTSAVSLAPVWLPCQLRLCMLIVAMWLFQIGGDILVLARLQRGMVRVFGDSGPESLGAQFVQPVVAGSAVDRVA